MKTKTHKFTLIVKSNSSKASARSAVLCSFGKRQPDYCSFHLSDYRKCAEIQRLHEIGNRLALALEAARAHGFHGGTALLTEWSSISDMPNTTVSQPRPVPPPSDGPRE